MKLKPPCEGIRYNGALAPLDGLEILDRDVEALKAEGWKEVDAPKPAKKMKKKTEDSE